MLQPGIMPLTREDLHSGLHRFATKHDLDRFPTKVEMADLRDTTARGFEDMRHHIDLLARELTSALAVLLDRLEARSDSAGGRAASGRPDSAEGVRESGHPTGPA